MISVIDIVAILSLNVTILPTPENADEFELRRSSRPIHWRRAGWSRDDRSCATVAVDVEGRNALHLRNGSLLCREG
jgi:hypothetical protein